MKSNKQRYNDSLSKSARTSGGGNGGGGGWLAAFVVLLILLIGLRACGFMINGTDSGIEGIGNVIPDTGEIGKRFR